MRKTLIDFIISLFSKHLFLMLLVRLVGISVRRMCNMEKM